MAQETAALALQLGCEVRREEPMAAHTSFRIGGPAALYITVSDAAVLPRLLAACRDAGERVLFVGNGSNLLVSDAGFDGAVIRLVPASPCLTAADTITCSGGTPLQRLCLFARDQGLSGLEFAYGIPGTVGGALVMNAGAYGGEMAHVVTAATTASADGVRSWTAADMALGYRRSAFMACPEQMITSVTVTLSPDDPAAIGARMDDLLRRRKDKQPLEFPSAGSYFKRPEGHFAGALIEDCGLKGLRVGGAQVSEKHAGFVVNRGGATCADVRELERQVCETVRAAHGVTLEREVRLVTPTAEKE